MSKTALVYIADETKAIVPAIHIESDGQLRSRLEAFKDRLRHNHTVETFSTPEDLAEKLHRDFRRLLAANRSTAENNGEEEEEYTRAVKVLRDFR